MELFADEWSDLIRDLDRLMDPIDADLLIALVQGGPAKEKAISKVESMAIHCQKVGFDFTADYARRIIRRAQDISLTGKYGPTDFQKDIGILRERFDDECSWVILVFVEPNRMKLYPSVPLFTDVLDKFPSLHFDVSEAGRCYAFGRDTACVFHLMNILQSGLYVLASRLNVKFDRRNWDNVINDIEARIKEIEKHENVETTNLEWREDQTFFATAALQFRHFKDAWRNHVAHGREHYNAERAESIFNHVKEFMLHLSSKLAESVDLSNT